MKKIAFLSACFCLFLIGCSSNDDGNNPQDPNNGNGLMVSNFSITIDENPNSGSVVGNIDASSDQGSLSFEITQESPQGAMHVSGSGSITVLNAGLFDFETNPQLTATVAVSDGTETDNVSVVVDLLDVAENIFYGDAILRTQEEVDEFGAEQYDEITRSLQIWRTDGIESDIHDLSPLSTLKKIGTNLHIAGNAQLQSLDGLNQLVEIGDNLSIAGNLGLTDISALSGIVVVPWALRVTNNPALESLFGLHNVHTVEREIWLDGLGVTDLNGLESLTTVNDILVIAANPNLTSFAGLSNLSGTIEQITINNNPLLESVQGLNNLVEVSGLGVYGNHSLIDLDGLEGLTSLGYIDVSHNESITNFDALADVALSGFRLVNNPSLNSLVGLSSTQNILATVILHDLGSLESLEGLNSLTSIEGDFWIQNCGLLNLDALSNFTSNTGIFMISSNESLSDFCGLENIITQNGIGGTLNISDNAYNPSPFDIINGECSN